MAPSAYKNKKQPLALTIAKIWGKNQARNRRLRKRQSTSLSIPHVLFKFFPLPVRKVQCIIYDSPRVLWQV